MTGRLGRLIDAAELRRSCRSHSSTAHRSARAIPCRHQRPADGWHRTGTASVHPAGRSGPADQWHGVRWQAGTRKMGGISGTVQEHQPFHALTMYPQLVFVRGRHPEPGRVHREAVRFEESMPDRSFAACAGGRRRPTGTGTCRASSRSSSSRPWGLGRNLTISDHPTAKGNLSRTHSSEHRVRCALGTMRRPSQEIREPYRLSHPDEVGLVSPAGRCVRRTPGLRRRTTAWRV